jgi:hypothetical protein
VHTVLVGKPALMRPLGRPKPRLVDNIRLDLKALRWEGVD